MVSFKGADRQQTRLLPECLDDWVDEGNSIRAVDVFVDALELRHLGFDGVDPAATGRPAYHPSPMLKLYIYGYLNRVQSSRRLEREAGRNLEVMWLTGRLAPDHKTIADFRKDNGAAIRKVCARCVELCRKMGLLTKASVAIDGSKFNAVNSRDNNFTQGKIQRRQKQIEESVARYMSQLDTADRQTAEGAGSHFRSGYELYAHVLVAEQRGRSDEKLATIVAGQRPADLTRQESVAYDFASALVKGGVLPELTYKAAVEQFGVHGAAELSYLIGVYCMVSLTLNTFDVPVPD